MQGIGHEMIQVVEEICNEGNIGKICWGVNNEFPVYIEVLLYNLLMF